MKRRNTEGTYAFSAYVAGACGIQDLQGLLIGKDGTFTAAVEAFEIEPEDHFDRILGNLIARDELYIKGVLAEKIGVPLYLLVHRTGKSGVTIYEIGLDHQTRCPICVDSYKKTEAEFLSWWRAHKQTIQTKGYRNDFKKRVEQSYFDALLESHDEKWGGNIDGYLVSGSGADLDIWGVVENRYTNKVPIRKYDPQDFFQSGGGDYYTWLPLILLCRQLRLPLFLATYSNRANEERLMGLTRVEGLGANGLTYVRNEAGREIRPCDHILSDTGEVRHWFETNRGAPPPSLG